MRKIFCYNVHEDMSYKVKEPKQALDDAAAKSAKAMGW